MTRQENWKALRNKMRSRVDAFYKYKAGFTIQISYKLEILC